MWGRSLQNMFEKIAQIFRMKKRIPHDFVRKTILIVDDNELDRRLVRRTIEKIGHRAVSAENGKIGFQVAKDIQPDLIFADYQMPEQDGADMCKQLKADEDTKDIPIVFLTGVDAPAKVVECFDMGVDNYICKPINPKILTSQIRTIFKECLAS